MGSLNHAMKISLTLSLLALLSCSDQDEAQPETNKSPETPTKHFQGHRGLALWEQYFDKLNPDYQRVEWKCDSNEQLLHKTSETWMTTRGDTLATKTFDEFNQLIGVQIKTPQHSNYFWGEEYSVDSIHRVAPDTLKAYSEGQKTWHEYRRYNNFQLMEIKRFTRPDSPLVWDVFSYDRDGRIESVFDMTSKDKQIFEYKGEQLFKEWIQTADGHSVDQISYTYLEQDGIRVGQDESEKKVTEESFDEQDRPLSIKEWDARGKVHCKIFKYVNVKGDDPIDGI